MKCFYSKQVCYAFLPDGKKKIIWSQDYYDYVVESFGKNCLEVESFPITISCGKCIACRLKASREWGIRCMHEAQCHDENCFITLTFDDEELTKMCPDESIQREHIRKFMRKLRDWCRYKGKTEGIRYFACGEYGDKFGRPHYHICLFGFDFADKVKWRKKGNYTYYISETLSELWPHGFTTIGEVNMKSACYVARYACKKIGGNQADKHYKGRTPEFCATSTHPGIGHEWFQKHGETDFMINDSCIVNGYEIALPRYYNKLWERKNPETLTIAKNKRAEIASKKDEERRLELKRKIEIAINNNDLDAMNKAYKEDKQIDIQARKCLEEKFKKLTRCIEVQND